MTKEEAIAALQGYKDNPLVNNKEPFEMAISALEQTDIEQKSQEYEKAFMDGFESCADLFTKNRQPCEDAVSRDAVLMIASSPTLSVNETVAMIKRLPSVTQKSKTGHWFAWKPEDDVWRTTCSECGEETRTLWNYCPHCGAKMVEPQEREEQE